MINTIVLQRIVSIIIFNNYHQFMSQLNYKSYFNISTRIEQKNKDKKIIYTT